MKITHKKLNGIRFWSVWLVRNEFYRAVSWFAVADDFGNLLKVAPEQTAYSLG